MSQHLYRCVLNGTRVKVSLGYDEDLWGYYMDVTRAGEHDGLDPEDSSNASDEESDADSGGDWDGDEDSDREPSEDSVDVAEYRSTAEPVYADGLALPYYSGTQPNDPDDDLSFFREKLKDLGIAIPEVMFSAVERDREVCADGDVTEYDADGTAHPVYPHSFAPDSETVLVLGEFPTPRGAVTAVRQPYELNGPSAVYLVLASREVYRVISVHLKDSADLLGPDEFFVDARHLNPALMNAARESGLFEPTERTSRPNGWDQLLMPIWKIRQVGALHSELHEPV